MARYPGALWVPSPNVGGPIGAIRLGVAHVMSGTLAGTDSWFTNPQAQVSAHFGVGKDGTIHQYVDTAATAWAEANYNDVAISVEHEGQSGDSLTPQQLAADAALFQWLHQTHGIPLVRCTDPAGTGWIGHGELGVAGGDHLDCPGAPILAQLPTILAAAAGATSTPTPDPTPTPSPVEDTVVSPIVTFRPGQLDAFQVSAGTLWHKWGPTAGGAWANESVPAQCNGGKGIGQVTFPDQQPQVSTTAVPGAVCVTVEDAGGRAWMFFQGATGPWQVVELP